MNTLFKLGLLSLLVSSSSITFSASRRLYTKIAAQASKGNYTKIAIESSKMPFPNAELLGQFIDIINDYVKSYMLRKETDDQILKEKYAQVINGTNKRLSDLSAPYADNALRFKTLRVMDQAVLLDRNQANGLQGYYDKDSNNLFDKLGLLKKTVDKVLEEKKTK